MATLASERKQFITPGLISWLMMIGILLTIGLVSAFEFLPRV